MTGDAKELIRYRMERAAATLGEAKTLCETGQYSGSVNRAYYGMFYAAVALLLTKGLSSGKHIGLLALFDREFVKPGEADRRWSQALRRAYKQRIRGDYDDMAVVSGEEARALLADATAFVEWARRWLEDRGQLNRGA
ncbi:MAG: HEPN domain-containing protein [Planctomycetes bacterium]|nr:HEPN domain-containing protein [Planctomycetota bacterium]